jgi:hypothetical protein
VEYNFSRVPIVLQVDLKKSDGSTKPCFLIAMHAKSKFISGGETLWCTNREKFIRKAVKNRRVISSEWHEPSFYRLGLFPFINL